ncbi:SusC/RagA family TonB-linked outer membrane protein [Sphingobacterium alkalisoli]|nr:SusC/RagA family TonB-linked outer membrane protein [Sphingobacterium alkalisoli]
MGRVDNILVTVVIYMLLSVTNATAQLQGTVYSSESREPLNEATVQLLGGGRSTMTDREGKFSFETATAPDTLLVRYIGYLSKKTAVGSVMRDISVYLEKESNVIEEVAINTGFYSIPRERATGSFTQVDNGLLNRSVGGNILQRLEGVASGVQFVNAGGTGASDIRVRGLATIQSDASPLIVVDNFPYEGDISSINPNDIENITILKDAAAASIWGARAGNGVIVITTKQGRYNQKGQLSLNSNVTIGQKPDLMYSRNRLPSEVVMQIEREKYEHGGYYLSNVQQVPFPEYVEMLIALENGTLSQEDFARREAIMKTTEVREEAMAHLYQPSVYQQYALNARGGGERFTYFVSGGYDRNRADVIGNRNERINLNIQNTFKPAKELEFSTALWYSQQKAVNNGIGLNDLKGHATHVGLSPYTRLADNNGDPRAIIKDYRQTYIDEAEAQGLLDWQYRPLAERDLIDRQSNAEELRANVGVRYNFLDHFNLNATYQYIKGNSNSTVEYDKDSYYVRNMVNRFTQADGSRIIPHGGIFQQASPSASRSHSGRMQVNYEQRFGSDHQIYALAGGEVREFVERSMPGSTLYNYDPELMTGVTNFNYTQNYTVRPTSRARINAPSNSNLRFIDRYLSYFGNVSHTYREKYMLSGSMRWDGSNLFGVKTNQKGTPLWSVGGSWEISKEDWFRTEVIDYLRFRGTYGSAGNVNKTVSAYPTIYHWGAHWISQLPYSTLTSVGNPSLRWELINTANLGMDFRSKNNRLSGSVDYYLKNAHDLIGQDLLPPSTGIFTGGTAVNSNLVNYADLKTRGLDVQLNSRNLSGIFTWNSTVLINYVGNEVKDYATQDVLSIGYYAQNPAPPHRGVSRDIMYAMPWTGLDPSTGNLQVLIDGEVSQDYQTYYTSFNVENLIRAGVTVPPLYGSLRNEFSWKGISISALLTFKSNFVFRRKSIDPSSITDAHQNYHLDYLDRWLMPGDENLTNVPARMSTYDSYRAQSYSFSEILVTRGDFIRLQDLNVSYTFSESALKKAGFNNLRLFAYARNIGVLWKANRHGIDPDYVDADYVPPLQMAMGVQIGF